MSRTTLLAFLLALVASSATGSGPAAPGASAPLGARAGEGDEVSAFTVALDGAERALGSGELERAFQLISRALERDAKSPQAWALRARWAEAVPDRDERVYALHQELRLRVAQKAPKAEVKALRAQLVELDPIAIKLLEMNETFIDKLEGVATAYEKDQRPHSAIRVHKQILALDPEYQPSLDAIDRIASLPDPSLAGDAKPKDLFADVSDEWIREHDAKHATWDERARLERENYRTFTNAGYETLVRCAEAMEQMNAFYRIFFQYGTEEHGGSVSRIDLNIFKTRDEYLKLGIGPPVEWSGGHFTGGAVETYVGGQGFEQMSGTLFHEAAHQFVSLATSAAGWLNEGLASFFEGCRILPNGSVLMNMPANHRLFPLADRMERGWMSSATDGTSADDPNQTPDKAPTFGIVLENRYAWGPPWYAPTWGVVYFLYNYQDPVDGRFVYRQSFNVFIDKSGGRMGEGAVKNFEEVVLANPSKPLKGVDRTGRKQVALPKTVDELNVVWKEWILALRQEQLGLVDTTKPFLDWARYAVENKDPVAAMDHFEKGLVATPDDVELKLAFANFLADRKDTDRATKLVLQCLRLVEAEDEPDEKLLQELERLASKWDPKRKTLDRVQEEIAVAARSIVEGYEAASLPMMVMDVSWRLGNDLNVPDLFGNYERALRASGKSLKLWELAYNEKNLEGWDAIGDSAFKPGGSFIDSQFGEYSGDKFDFQMLTLEKVTSGDFSLEADVQATSGRVNFCGLVFGRKDASNFHALILFPAKPRKSDDSGVAKSAFIDLATFYGGGSFKTWRHNPLEIKGGEEGASTTGTWTKLRIDVSGRTVDAWADGQLIATQQFPSLDVLRGSFGLITGPGASQYKEVRYMSRDPRDPAGKLERQVRMEKIRSVGGGAVGGSWQGQVPPWPQVSRWVQEPRESWQEAGLAPQLMVLWSIHQNEIIPIDGWLRELHQKYSPKGLRIVCITSPNDEETIDGYLAEHPFPGSVGVDYREEIGVGETNKAFFTPRFNLPRLLLLDLDGKVVWEGDPGFGAAEPWVSGMESYLEVPLNDLIATRRIDELLAWLESWKQGGAQLLSRGELEKVLPKMLEGRTFDGNLVPEVYDVQRKLAALESALTELEDTADELKKSDREPAFEVLLLWAAALEIEIDKRRLLSFKSIRESKNAKEWARAVKQATSFRERIQKDPAEAEELASRLDKLDGPFPADLADEVRSLATVGDSAGLDALLADVEAIPRRWLGRDHFNW